MEHRIGVGWYRKEQWARLRSVSTDAKNLEPSYEDWLANAENALLNLHAEGADAVKVDVDVEELIRWCQEKKLPVDGKSRSAFVTERLMRLDR
jgi:hypothetical protein